MSPLAIVIHFNVFENSSFCFVPSPELIPMNQFNLERVKEALSDGIIPWSKVWCPNCDGSMSHMSQQVSGSPKIKPPVDIGGLEKRLIKQVTKKGDFGLQNFLSLNHTVNFAIIFCIYTSPKNLYAKKEC